jgi:hypothetical protein
LRISALSTVTAKAILPDGSTCVQRENTAKLVIVSFAFS